MKFKANVNLNGAQGVIINAMSQVDFIYSNFGQELVVTSVMDGVHSKNSLHYKGLAFDTRTWYFTKSVLEDLLVCLRIALGSDYDVVLEKDHFHIEYDPD